MPTGQNLAMMFIGVLLVVVGGLMIAKEGFARFTLKLGGARIWNALLGEERALKLARYCFGPVEVLLGLLLVAGSFLAGHADHVH